MTAYEPDMQLTTKIGPYEISAIINYSYRLNETCIFFNDTSLVVGTFANYEVVCDTVRFIVENGN